MIFHLDVCCNKIVYQLNPRFDNIVESLAMPSF